MINWNDIKVEQEIAQERYQQIIEARQVDHAQEKEQPTLSFFEKLGNWLTSATGQTHVSRKQQVQCCAE